MDKDEPQAAASDTPLINLKNEMRQIGRRFTYFLTKLNLTLKRMIKWCIELYFQQIAGFQKPDQKWRW